MSNHKLREDTICQNCHYTVDRAYCSNCGQKNTETRQSFLHLITHFAEDFTHYDGAFWKTIKHLFFWPAKLTKEYLEGKRQTYVPPVKLYIFISFVTFFLIAVLDKDDKGHHNISPSSVPVKTEIEFNDRIFESYDDFKNYLESEEAKGLGAVEYWAAKALLIANDRNLDGDKFVEAYFHMLPKVLFIYMPVFAFWLWLFHGKKKWYFFDHGIFTLHYFAFLLLSISITEIVMFIVSSISKSIEDNVMYFIVVLLGIYWVFYFFRAHSRMYGERKLISRLKSFFLFCINLICIVMALITALFYVLYTMH